MSIVKKWISCVMSFVAGVLGLAMSACTGMVVNANIDALAVPTYGSALSQSSNEVTKAFEVITNAELFTKAQELGITTEFVWLKTFAIIMLVLAVLLIAYAVVMLLKNINVIKVESKAFDIVGWVLAGLFLVAGIGLFVTTNVYASALEEAMINAYKLGYAAKLATMLPAVQVPTVLSLIKFNATASMGLYQPFMLTVSIVLAIATRVFAFIKRKDA